MKLDETRPHSRNELVSPNLVKVVQWSLRNVSEKLNDFVGGCLEFPDELVTNKQDQEPKQINQVYDNDWVK